MMALFEDSKHETVRAFGKQIESGVRRGILSAIVRGMGTDELLEFAVEMDWAKFCYGDDFDRVFDLFQKQNEPTWQESWRVAQEQFLLSSPEV